MSKIIKYEPSTFEEAAKHQEWKNAMNEEYQSIMKNGIWKIVPRPENKSVLTSKWLYKIKQVADGSIDKFKARFMARGFSQEEGKVYHDLISDISDSNNGMEGTSNGCQNSILEWYHR